MKKLDPTDTTITRDFYRPHARVYAPTLVADPATGELVKPVPRTKQEFKDECDINNIIKLYKQTGQITHIKQAGAQGAYADLPDPLDFQASLNLVMEAEASFMTLPAHVRDRFANDPARFLAFMGDPGNQDEMIQMGLATRKAESEPETASGGGTTPPPKAPPVSASTPAPEPPKPA